MPDASPPPIPPKSPARPKGITYTSFNASAGTNPEMPSTDASLSGPPQAPASDLAMASVDSNPAASVGSGAGESHVNITPFITDQASAARTKNALKKAAARVRPIFHRVIKAIKKPFVKGKRDSFLGEPYVVIEDLDYYEEPEEPGSDPSFITGQSTIADPSIGADPSLEELPHRLPWNCMLGARRRPGRDDTVLDVLQTIPEVESNSDADSPRRRHPTIPPRLSSLPRSLTQANIGESSPEPQASGSANDHPALQGPVARAAAAARQSHHSCGTSGGGDSRYGGASGSRGNGNDDGNGMFF